MQHLCKHELNPTISQTLHKSIFPSLEQILHLPPTLWDQIFLMHGKLPSGLKIKELVGKGVLKTHMLRYYVLQHVDLGKERIYLQ